MHALSVIPHQELNIGTGRQLSVGMPIREFTVDDHVRRLDDESAAQWHRITRIQDQIEQYLFELPSICHYRVLSGLAPHDKLCVLAQRPSDDGGHAIDDLSGREHGGLKHLTTAEGQ